ncbi:MAG TPA: 3-dehydroquinate synthase family protein, partial [Saprospiraceae bacterium]|nr:3-dehydroquinate synthase family protein [Saprospiraceae bacterium]
FGHIPTTVLAMADASIGGKTGIDYEGLKNYIGVIRVPSFVWVDQIFLSTLSAKQKTSGLAEIVKHAIIGSKELWDLLTAINSVEEISWESILKTNLPIKVKIVESDLSEKGYRKVLNFGHTIGHAVESYFLSTSTSITHGQCVATGMLVESKISNSLGLLNNEDFNAIVRIADQLLEPIRISLPTFAELNRWMMRDKKKSNAIIGFSLPDRIGSCRWDIPVDEQVISDSFQWLAQV